MTHSISIYTQVDWETSARNVRDHPACSSRPAPQMNSLPLAWAVRLIAACCQAAMPSDRKGRTLV
jgi:hypothetical protein